MQYGAEFPLDFPEKQESLQEILPCTATQEILIFFQ